MLKDEGNTVDPVSGNEVPSGSMQKEVRDDVPAQLSEGEFVFPADVVRYVGLEKLMAIRQNAKMGLAQMEAMGQMGNSEEAIIPDNIPMVSEIDRLIDSYEPEQTTKVSEEKDIKKFETGGDVYRNTFNQLMNREYDETLKNPSGDTQMNNTPIDNIKNPEIPEVKIPIKKKEYDGTSDEEEQRKKDEEVVTRDYLNMQNDMYKQGYLEKPEVDPTESTFGLLTGTGMALTGLKEFEKRKELIEKAKELGFEEKKYETNFDNLNPNQKFQNLDEQLIDWWSTSGKNKNNTGEREIAKSDGVGKFPTNYKSRDGDTISSTYSEEDDDAVQSGYFNATDANRDSDFDDDIEGAGYAPPFFNKGGLMKKKVKKKINLKKGGLATKRSK